MRWLKANVDGTAYSSENRVSIEGVLRDSNGGWQFGFMRNLGSCPVLLAEIRAIHNMILHSWRLRHRQVELKTDNLETVRILKGTSSALSSHDIVASIQEMLTFE
ncbi:hypothetical protein V6N11_044827 [Hibiscus sabdariffa]|uniref:RNase H type-1 domain-containing protein n=1 Tax=Hibiscus sabdariffa TaxID=183260 RepID=A0ABR2PU62_9ROSI